MAQTETPRTPPESARRTAPWLVLIAELLVGKALLAAVGPRVVPLLAGAGA
jgi:hypothetical protein